MSELAEYLDDPRRAVTADGITCLVCGRIFRHLTNTHLRRHGLTSGSYKARFGYNGRRALMTASLRRVHAENAIRSDLASRIRRQALDEDRELRRQGGRRPHRLEELLTRREREQMRPVPLTRDSRGRFANRSGAAGAEPREHERLLHLVP